MRPCRHRVVHRALGVGGERVRRAVVAVHAVHPPALALRELLRRRAGDVYSRTVPSRVSHPHVRDHLPLGIGGDVLDLVGEVHVPVDAGADAQRRAAAADVHRQRRDRLGVLLVVGVFTEHAHLVAVELLGPVALLAGVARRPHRVHGRRHGLSARSGVDDLPELPRARHLRLDQCADTRADVARDARHARMRTALMRDVLRLHRRMTHLPAELRRSPCSARRRTTPSRGARDSRTVSTTTTAMIFRWRGIVKSKTGQSAGGAQAKAGGGARPAARQAE